MLEEVDENYDPALLFDGYIDIDPNSMCIEQDFNDMQDIWKSCSFDFPPSILETDAIDTLDDYEEVLSRDVPLNRKEWLVQDSTSKRQRSPRLFEFLILLLGKPQYHSYASFIDRTKGIFQIHQPEKVAELWQAVKSRQSNQRMTYDKFARAIRWYYKSNIMQKTNTRYTFQFSSKTLKSYFLDENNNTKMGLSS